MPEIMSKCPAGNTLDPTKDATYTLIESAVKELLFDGVYNQTFNLLPMIHLGGDEVNTNCWNNDPAIAQYMKDNNMNVQ